MKLHLLIVINYNLSKIYLLQEHSVLHYYYERRIGPYLPLFFRVEPLSGASQLSPAK